MEIYLHSRTMLRIKTQYHPEIVARLKTLPQRAWDSQAKCWYVPVAQLNRLLELFPLASLDYEVFGVWDRTDGSVGAFYRSLVQMGVKLEIDAGGAVVGSGDNVSPALQQLIAERSAELRPLLQPSAAFEGKRAKRSSNGETLVRAAAVHR